MKYKVTYLNKDSKKLTEIVESDDKDKIVIDYKSYGYRIISIELQDQKIKPKSKKRNKVSDKQLHEFLKQFSILLNAGIDIKSTIDILYEQENFSDLGKTLGKIIERLNDGLTLSEAMKSTEVFPDLVINVIDAGEQSSQLPAGIILLSNHYDEEIKLKQSIKNSLYYPILLLIVTLIIVVLIITFVLPSFASVFSMYDNSELPYITRILLSIASFMGKNYLVVLLILIALGLIIRGIWRTQQFKYFVAKNLLKIPKIGQYVVNLEIQRFSGIFSLTNMSGMDTVSGLEVAANSVNNLYLKEKLKDAIPKITLGQTIYNSFNKIKELPKMFVNLVNVGENSSNLSDTMKISYDYFKQSNENEGKKLIALLEPLIIIFVSLIVGAVVLAIVLPTFNIVNII